jgi:hypothetical protein
MGPAARRLELVPDLVSDGLLCDEDFLRVQADARFLECQSERLQQAPHVFFDRGPGNPAREDRAPVRVLRVEFVEIVGADCQLDLARALCEAGMIREEIKKNALRQRKTQLIFKTAIDKEYCDNLFTRQATAPRHPKAMHDAKMGSCRAEMGNLRDEQVHLVEDGR